MLIYNPKMQFFTADGTAPLNGGKVFIYLPGTTTKQNTYTDSTLGTANSNPIVLDSAGRPSVDMYIGASFKMVVTTSSDTDPPAAPIWTEDNITSQGQLITVSNKTTNYTVTTSDRDKLLTCDTSGGGFTVTLLAAATAGAGFNLKIKKSSNDSNTLTVTANGAELIDFANSVATTNGGAYLEVNCDGTQWWICRTVPQSFQDANGLAILNFTSTASAVNYWTLANAATGNSPTIGVAGSDTNIGMSLQTKGTGVYKFLGTATAPTQINLYEQTSNGTNSIGILAPASIASDFVYTLPSVAGTAGQHIRHSATAGTLVQKSAMHFENMEVFKTSGTFTAPTDVNTVFVEAWGTGGSGGGVNGAGVAGSGGGAAYSCGIVTVTPGGATTVTIGAAGATVATNTNGTGGDGGSSSFGALVVAAGGSGGGSGASGVGGAGGTVAGSTAPTDGYALAGSAGLGGTTATGFIGLSWGGPAAKMGAISPSLAATPPANTGGGGGGGTSTGPSAVGATGLVVVYY